MDENTQGASPMPEEEVKPVTEGEGMETASPAVEEKQTEGEANPM